MMRFRLSLLPLCVLVVLVVANSLQAANITWIGGNGVWSEGAPNNVNWSPADEPDPDDVAIFNTSNSVRLGSNNTVLGLTLSGDVGLSLNDYSLTVNGATTIGTAGTYLKIDGGNASFTGQNVTVNNGGQFLLDGGTVHLDISGNPSALLAVNNGGLLAGNGAIVMDDIPANVTTVIRNGGTITAGNPSGSLLVPPSAGSLTFDAWSANVRIDLDGVSDNGVVNVTRNQTLNVNIPLADAFNSKMNLGHDSTLNIKHAWTFSGSGTISVDNGAVLELPGIAAGVTTIGGGTMNQTGGTITVEDEDGTLRFNASLNMTGGNLVNNGLVIFDADATIGLNANVAMPADSSSITIKSNRNVQINQQSFSLDGNGTDSNVVTIEKGGRLGLNLGAAADRALSGVVNLQGAELNVLTHDNLWSIDGILNVTGSDATSTISGAIATFDAADVTIAPGARLNVASASHWEAGTNVAIGANAKLTLATTTFKGPAAIGGDGQLELTLGSHVQSNTAIDVAFFDWDGAAGGHLHSIANGTTFTINSQQFDDDADMDDDVSIGGAASLIVNSEPKWTMQGTLTANSVGVGTAVIGGSSTMSLGSTGIMNVNGNTNLVARVAFESGSATNVVSTAKLTLQGGTDDAPNVISGGAIVGAGTLSLEPGRILRGHGLITPNIVNAGEGQLLADDGELTLSGAINDVGALGTADADGVLNILNAWSTSVAVDVRLAGGELKGGTISVENATGIRGSGLVSARLVNNTVIQAESGTLVLKTLNDDNDWDGLENEGALSAINGATLELHDNVQFNYFGAVTATGASRVRAKDFSLHLKSGSTLTLAGSVFESQRGSDIGGQIIVAAGPQSTLQSGPNYPLNLEKTSTVALDGDLRILGNNATIDAGATFTGDGALIIPNGSRLVARADANVGVLLDVQGELQLADSNSVGRVDVKNYRQSSTGKLFVELAGMSLNQFDRLAVDDTAHLNGSLLLDINGGFVPSLGQTYPILTAGNGVFGTFNDVAVSGMPAGLTFNVNYLADAVQLQVVSESAYAAADFNRDGHVDAADLDFWKASFGLNPLGDANGDNRTDGSDFLIWQRQFSGGLALPAVQSAATAVPEPATGALLLLASTSLLALRRRAGQ